MKGDKEKYDEDMEKTEGEDEEMEDEGKKKDVEGEDEEEAEKGCKKSDDLDEDDLQKSLDKLQDLANEGDTGSRKEYLLSKAQVESLSKSEQTELFGILGGSEGAPESSLADEVVRGYEENPEMQKAMDVSDFIDEQATELNKSMRILADHVEQSDNRQHEFNLVLARAVAETGKMVKSMCNRLGVIEEQPARAPKSRGVRPMEKSFANSAPASEQLSKSQILDEMETMISESVSKGLAGASDEGVDLVTAASKYEQFNQIQPSLLKAVQERIKTKGAVA
ncbi:MAG: hypothetical protein JSW58_07385 [Candidatus Latescibacterota bacterium]|nr:MAG: hypothetical protein JSW58_07385 [Candidatus Latescibacterota bacterium]